MYLVGGAVRDRLLGIEGGDKDYVVVGANPEQMLAAGFVPVGKDFPVFIHPRDNCEYALARTERKLAKGYHGFSFHADASITLEQDLLRRDLTINAIAQDANGQLIDPYGGQADIHARVLRHVSDSFVEDPVRILRTARLMARLVARYPEFTVAPETLTLMKVMVERGEVDALVAERVWKEISRGLVEAQPSQMFRLLMQCNALERLCPELSFTAPLASALDRCRSDVPLVIRYAIVSFECSSVEHVNQRWRVPNECADLAVLLDRERQAILTLCAQLVPAVEVTTDLDPLLAIPKTSEPLTKLQMSERIVTLLERCDALRKPSRFQQALSALMLYYETQMPEAASQQLSNALVAAAGVNAGEIAMAIQQDSLSNNVDDAGQKLRAQKTVPEQIKVQVHEARVRAVLLLLG